MREIVYLDVCWFVTTDHRLLNRATTERERLRLEVVFPDQVPLPGRGDQR